MRLNALFPTRRALLAATLAAPALRPTGAAAQAFPDRPIRLVVPFPPGGPVDTAARIVAAALTEELKSSVVVENRSGAGGVVGTDAVAKAEPDGYTLSFSSTGAVAVNVTLLPNIAYDPRKDFAPVSIVAAVPSLLAVNPDLPARSVAELVALAKSRPGRLNFGSAGPGGTPHLAGELFRLRTGVNITHVPYRGAAPAITALLAKEVDLAFLDLPVLLPHVREGRLHPLALTSAARSPALPEIPTFAEAGIDGMEVENWYAALAPAGTPPERVKRLHAAIAAVMARPATAKQFTSQGARVIASPPEEATAFIRREVERWAEVVRAADVRLD
ncbi:tripartite tricarboxylate transporter substrate binding protein [Roseomonas sp. E05]|uniref:Bug family tripartite tricarboxylate transporter substrate binding protein n=1 Tax=Roseomonas sp. E05 TaxID=3046310 RepID=UPI0024BA252C|nr:tripartite tricarboxylate transporter substrate binding protein [Roseomonas sp. E05]MDJ0389140.1 tripartite tricarboxylate transporter substrate binding protein [Roseomonas sp. E05]